MGVVTCGNRLEFSNEVLFVKKKNSRGAFYRPNFCTKKLCLKAAKLEMIKNFY